MIVAFAITALVLGILAFFVTPPSRMEGDEASARPAERAYVAAMRTRERAVDAAVNRREMSRRAWGVTTTKPPRRWPLFNLRRH